MTVTQLCTALHSTALVPGAGRQHAAQAESSQGQRHCIAQHSIAAVVCRRVGFSMQQIWQHCCTLVACNSISIPVVCWYAYRSISTWAGHIADATAAAAVLKQPGNHHCSALTSKHTYNTTGKSRAKVGNAAKSQGECTCVHYFGQLTADHLITAMPNTPWHVASPVWFHASYWSLLGSLSVGQTCTMSMRQVPSSE